VGSTAVLETIPVVLNGGITLQASASVPWLTVSVVAGGIQIVPNATAVAAANVAVQIFVSAAEIPGSQVALSTTITVLANPTFTVDTTPITISLYSGLTLTPLPTRTITYDFKGQYYTFDAVSSNPSWLYPSLTMGSAAGLIQLQINVGQLPVGTYTGSISITIAGAPNPPQIVPVTYTVLAAPTMTLSTTAVTMTVQPGQTSTFSISVASSVPNFPVTLFVGTSPVLFTATLSSQTTPAQVVLTASPPANLALGIYYFTMTIGLKGQSDKLVNGTIGVTAPSGASAVPASLTATDYRGGPYGFSAPTIQVVAPQPTTVTLASDQTWISFTSPTIITPNSSYVVFNAGPLKEGSYKGNIFVRDSSGKTIQTIPVAFSVYDPAVLTYSNAPIAFQYNQGDPPPGKQTLHISSPSITPGYFDIGPDSYPNWLSATPQETVTPADITLTADPTGMSPGVYQTTLRISGVYSLAGTVGGGSIPVTLTISGSAHPLISAVVSAASGLPGPVSPGELVLIYGSGLGSTGVSSAQLTSGSLPSSWNGTTVMFGEFSAPVLYTSSNVVCVVVPYGVSARSSVNVSVSFQGNQGLITPVSVGASAPGLFTADESGGGQASVFTVNPDGSYQISNTAHPATAGNVLVVYLTGAGVVSPASPDGSVNATGVGSPLGVVSATIGNQPAPVLFCGTVPGLLNGVLQVNIQVPAGVPSGTHVPLAAFVAGSPTQPGVTLAIK
jgi:uncharacterized protein (TIGR03437 family)